MWNWLEFNETSKPTEAGEYVVLVNGSVRVYEWYAEKGCWKNEWYGNNCKQPNKTWVTHFTKPILPQENLKKELTSNN